MFAHLRDPKLPALETLRQADLDRITGTTGTRLLRARYKPGARAILHVAMGASPEAAEGSIWIYDGTKARKLGQHFPEAHLDVETGALFQAFPHDHRMPQPARFVVEAMDLAPHLIGGPAAGPPSPMRYRPGLSATFRWVRADGRVFYVKQTPDDDVATHASTVSRLVMATEGQSLGFAPVQGVIPDLGLIAYAAVEGQPMDRALAGAGPALAARVMSQVVHSLESLWSLPIVPDRILDRNSLLVRAEQARSTITIFDPESGGIAARLVTGLHGSMAPVRQRPIHADMKLEHAFLSGPRTTLIDIESLSLGDPDYDLAKLEARAKMAALAGQISDAEAYAATAALRSSAGPHYQWFLTCARLQCARFFAQRFDPGTIPLMRRVLGPC